MKTILLNDTSGTNNPGCKGTVYCLLENLAKAGFMHGGSIPVGYAYQPFIHKAGAQRRVTGVRSLIRAVRMGRSAPPLPPEKTWAIGRDQLIERMRPLWSGTEALIINGEGTIHDDAVGARSLIGLAAAAKTLGLRVAILNASVFSLSDWLLDALRNSVDDLAVREPVSFRYLQDKGIPCRLTADCLFLAQGIPGAPLPSWLSPSPGTPYAVYSPGVLSGTDKATADTVASDIRALRSTCRAVYYYVVEVEDEPLARAAAQAGAQIIPLGALHWRSVVAFLKNAELLVSGRYHLNIFAAMAGIPFIPLESNTPKMEGLLALLEVHPDRSALDWRGGDNRLHSASPIKVDANILAACAQAASANIPAWGTSPLTSGEAR